MGTARAGRIHGDVSIERSERLAVSLAKPRPNDPVGAPVADVA
jgi:hypothetical protein